MERVRKNTSYAAVSLIFVVFMIFLTRIVALSQEVDPWIDEAMLLLNLPVSNDRLASPMPLYHQAAPLGYVWLASRLAEAFPDHVAFALRTLSALASIAAAAFLYDALKSCRAKAAAPLALALGFLTAVPTLYSIEIKHYELEVAVTSLLCAAGARMAANVLPRTQIFALLAMVLAILFSFTAPVAIASIFAGIVAVRYRAILARPVGETLAIVLPFAVAGIGFVACHLLYTRPVTADQFDAYRMLYESGLVRFHVRSLEDVKVWLRFPFLLFSPYIPGGVIPTALVIALFCVTFPFALRGNRFFAISLVIAGATVYLLNILGLLPFREVRHFLFLVPLVVVVLAEGLWQTLRFIECRRAMRVPLAAMFTSVTASLIAAGGLYFALHQERSEVSPLIATYRQQGRGEPLWVFPMAQPAVQLLAPDIRQVGLLPHHTSKQDWTRAVWSQEAQQRGDYEYEPRYAEVFARDISGLDRVWLLFSNSGAGAPESLTARARSLHLGCVLKDSDFGTELYRCARSEQPSTPAVAPRAHSDS
jgi:hypothetical protein